MQGAFSANNKNQWKQGIDQLKNNLQIINHECILSSEARNYYFLLLLDKFNCKPKSIIYLDSVQLQ
jgi:hypothetical protein